MRKSRFSEEQIIGILREQVAGVAMAEVLRKHGISAATFYKWKVVNADCDFLKKVWIDMLAGSSRNTCRAGSVSASRKAWRKAAATIVGRPLGKWANAHRSP